MPNWPLSQEIRGHIVNRAGALAQRMVDLNRLEFPLRPSQVQKCGCGLTEEQLGMLQALEKGNVLSIQKDRDIHVAFTRERVPELRRGIVFRIQLSRSLFVQKITHVIQNNPRRLGDVDALEGHLDCFNPDERAQIVEWMEKLLKQVRIKEIVWECVGFLTDVSKAPTAAHLKHLWPGLASVIDGKDYATWVERFRHPPERGLSRYVPDRKLLLRYGPLMKLCDTQIAAGQLIAPVKFDQTPGAIYPVIENWERLPDDLIFPLAY